MEIYKLHKLNVVFSGLLIFLVVSTQCKKEDIAVVTLKTYVAENITGISAKIKGEIILNSGATITKRGVCVSAKSSPTLIDGHMKSSVTTDTFSVDVSNLLYLTKYYYRAFVESSTGIYYGNELTFTTTIAAPKIIIDEVNYISGSMAFCNIDLTSTGGGVVTSKGVVWSASQNPTLTSNLGSSTSAKYGVSIIGVISGLTSNTTYYVRAYATNSVELDIAHKCNSQPIVLLIVARFTMYRAMYIQQY